MKPPRRRAASPSITAWLLTITVAPAAALAALGGGTNTVEGDRAALKGELHSTPMTQYDVQQITVGSSTVVREYTSLTGQVFAITWQGPTRPDLQQLLGAYFGSFKSAAAAHQLRPGTHRQLNIQQPDLVVQSYGRLRSFRGLAYVPSLLPAGVAVGDLQ
jgi:Protein of unknown function (DUF2844)